MVSSKSPRHVVVVGGGLAGLSAALKLTENGCTVSILSVTKVRRSHSVCAQGGINAAVNSKGENDSPLIHTYDTIKGGDFLANQPPILEMCYAAPKIIAMLDRFGCTFNRTPEGDLDFRRFGGTLYNRTAFCGASTGQQLLYALDEQVRRQEVHGKVKKYENHEFMRLVLDDQGIARGVVYMDLFNLKLDVLKADAVVIATGGLGLLFKKSTNSTFCTGAANGRLFMQGLKYANGEFIQIHPTAIPGIDKLRLISESVRGEGGRIWVYGDSTKSIETPSGKIPCGETGKPWYFLEEMYPAFGNLVPRDIGAREVLRICEMGLGVNGGMQVYLDVTHLPSETIHKLESVLDIYKKFTGTDPKKIPMQIFPAVHYSMGGAWVDWPAADDPDRMQRFRQMTNLRGCFAAGECDYQFHGANRLGANALLACIFAGLVCGQEVPRYLDSLKESFEQTPEKYYREAIEKEEEIKQELMQRAGGENVFLLHEELADLLVRNVTVKRNNHDLAITFQKIEEIEKRFQKITLGDHGQYANQSYIFANQFKYMIVLAKVIVKGALVRNESRGAHFKPEFPERDDENWLKTSIATYSTDDIKMTYEEVDTRHIDPRGILRDYTKGVKKVPTLQNIPSNLESQLPL